MAKIGKKKKTDFSWIIKITLVTFIISFFFDFISESTLDNVNVLAGIVLLLVVVLIGVLFDMVGISVTSADIEPFNSMNARKIKGADIAVKFIKNAEKVSTFCNDVVGDICGIISGSASAAVAILIAEEYDLPLLIVTLFVAATTAAITIFGKAIAKSVSISNSTAILSWFTNLIAPFYKIKK